MHCNHSVSLLQVRVTTLITHIIITTIITCKIVITYITSKLVPSIAVMIKQV